jgi:hypothetical protein
MEESNDDNREQGGIQEGYMAFVSCRRPGAQPQSVPGGSFGGAGFLWPELIELWAFVLFLDSPSSFECAACLFSFYFETYQITSFNCEKLRGFDTYILFEATHYSILLCTQTRHTNKRSRMCLGYSRAVMLNFATW